MLFDGRNSSICTHSANKNIVCLREMSHERLCHTQAAAELINNVADCHLGTEVLERGRLTNFLFVHKGDNYAALRSAVSKLKKLRTMAVVKKKI